MATVLLVEDDEHIAMLVRFIVEREGFEVHEAPDGRAAAALVDTAPPPVVALLDVMVPYLSGFDLIERIRTSPTWSAVPIIMLTAKSGEQDIVQALDLGANDYVVKPFRPEELMARIRRLLPRPA